MARRAPAGVAAAICLVAATFAVAGAQSLQRLAVESFVLSSDTASPRVGTPFHLTVTLRVRERVARIDNLNLPILAQLELLGDERETASGPRGTLYRESITVVAHEGGALAIAPATLQAIDARDGKPKQWFTNELRLRVIGAPGQPLGGGPGALLAATLAALRLFLWVSVLVLGLGCAAAVVVLLFRRRPVARPVPVPPPAPVQRTRSRREEAEAALVALRAQQSRSTAVAVRAAIWRMAGASDGETLNDVLRRADPHDTTMRDLLTALERSAFTYDGDLHAAIDDTCRVLERYIGSAP
ncbi:MAG: hypothetical protein WCC84_04130 [Candidatus Cybelea sp.]